MSWHDWYNFTLLQCDYSDPGFKVGDHVVVQSNWNDGKPEYPRFHGYILSVTNMAWGPNYAVRRWNAEKDFRGDYKLSDCDFCRPSELRKPLPEDEKEIWWRL